MSLLALAVIVWQVIAVLSKKPRDAVEFGIIIWSREEMVTDCHVTAGARNLAEWQKPADRQHWRSAVVSMRRWLTCPVWLVTLTTTSRWPGRSTRPTRQVRSVLSWPRPQTTTSHTSCSTKVCLTTVRAWVWLIILEIFSNQFVQ